MDREFVIARYYVEASVPIEKAARMIAAEQSTGTWTEVWTETEDIQERYGARVERIDGNLVDIAIPVEDFDLERGGICCILSIVAGNVFGLAAIRNLRLLDIEIPRSILREFGGPRFGIDGIRRIIGTDRERRPHLGTIVKPKIGLDPRKFAQVAYEAFIGGVDFVKDDETLISQRFCPLEDRVSAVMEAVDRAREETGRNFLYATNITSRGTKLLELADLVKELGGNMLMIDAVIAGIDNVRILSEDSSVKLPIHVHRAMHAAMTRNKKHGISMMVFAKLIRLAGGDQLHVGAPAGKMEKDLREVLEIADFLRKDWNGIKTVFPVASGGVHPGNVYKNLRYLGVDCVIQAGGGIHGHPKGTRAGAKAMRQAIDSFMRGLSIEEASGRFEELRLALEKWGVEE